MPQNDVGQRIENLTVNGLIFFGCKHEHCSSFHLKLLSFRGFLQLQFRGTRNLFNLA